MSAFSDLSAVPDLSVAAPRWYVLRHAQPLIAKGICYGQLNVAADAALTHTAATAFAAHLQTAYGARHGADGANGPHGGHAPTVRLQCSPLQRCQQLAHALQPLLATHGVAHHVEEQQVGQPRHHGRGGGIAARAGLHAKAEAFMADLFALGERGYLEANPDVAAAIGKGGIVSGMHHFLRYGEAEGRGGFDGVVQAGILYNRVHGTAFNLLQVVKSLKKSIPPAA